MYVLCRRINAILDEAILQLCQVLCTA